MFQYLMLKFRFDIFTGNNIEQPTFLRNSTVNCIFCLAIRCKTGDGQLPLDQVRPGVYVLEKRADSLIHCCDPTVFLKPLLSDYFIDQKSSPSLQNVKLVLSGQSNSGVPIFQIGYQGAFEMFYTTDQEIKDFGSDVATIKF